MKTLDSILEMSAIHTGDIILLSSETLKVFRKCKTEDSEFQMDMLIDVFKDAVGIDGTLLIPTYNWGFCKGKTFDYYKTRGAAGALGNLALRRTDFIRTKHPIYSFAVWGADCDYLCSLENVDSFGEDSVFAYMHNRKAYNVLLDVDYNHSFTFLHYVEQDVGAAYRYRKGFTAEYIGPEHNSEVKTYYMYVRDLDLDVHMMLEDDRFEDYLISEAGAQKMENDGTVVRKIRFDLAYDAIRKDILTNRSRNLCYYKGQDGL